jgi:hypothetical protein
LLALAMRERANLLGAIALARGLLAGWRGDFPRALLDAFEEVLLEHDAHSDSAAAQ